MNKTVFQNGDAIRLRIQTNGAICLSALRKGSSGVWSLLFPGRGQAGRGRVSALQPFEIPPPPGRFMFDNWGGIEDVYLIAWPSYIGVDPLLAALARVRAAEIAGPLTAANTGMQGAVLKEVRQSSKGMGSRDLVIGQTEEEAADVLKDVVFYAGHMAGSVGAPKLVHFEPQPFRRHQQMSGTFSLLPPGELINCLVAAMRFALRCQPALPQTNISRNAFAVVCSGFRFFPLGVPGCDFGVKIKWLMAVIRNCEHRSDSNDKKHYYRCNRCTVQHTVSSR